MNCDLGFNSRIQMSEHRKFVDFKNISYPENFSLLAYREMPQNRVAKIHPGRQINKQEKRVYPKPCENTCPST